MLPALSATIWVSLKFARTAQMPEPGAISLRLATTGPTASGAACRMLAPVPVRPEETITEVRDRSRGR